MAETEKVAIARVVIRSKEQLVAIRAMDDVLEMATMLFADEVSSPDRLDELPDPKEVKTTKREVDVAKQLIGSLAGDFEPEKYRDTYRADVLALIERKAEGKEIAVQPEAEDIPGPAPDLMSALKASLDAVRKRSGDNGAAAKKRKPATKKTAAKKPAAAKSAGKKAPAKKAPAKRAAAKR
jgi:DNA end-binding protein Ku